MRTLILNHTRRRNEAIRHDGWTAGRSRVITDSSRSSRIQHVCTELEGQKSIAALWQNVDRGIAFEGVALARMGKKDEGRALLDRLLKLGEQQFVPPYHIALLYNALGDREQTYAWLERAFEVNDPKVTFLKVDPKWNNLRNEQKFQELLKRAGF